MSKRLHDPYKQGMKDYLGVKVTDYSDEDISDWDEEVRKKFNDLRLKKNSEFAFKEVYDDVSFDDNSGVVEDMVKLL